MNVQRTPTVSVNGRDYRFPKTPTVVVCIDGSEPGYIERAIDAGLAPNLARLMRDGANLSALSAMPSFTNPNNISIITGRPPAVHGIAGNYFYDRQSGKEVMMNDASFLRAPTIMQAFHDAGAKVAVVTAKDKLRALLGNGLDMASGRAIAFSSEKADKATRAGARHRRRARARRHAAARRLFLAAVRIRDGGRRLDPQARAAGPDVSLDHRLCAAQGGARLGFRQCVLRHDGPLRRRARRRRLRAGAHRRSRHERQAPAEPRARRALSADLLDEWLGKGIARVILPITDPYVVHHGALGSFATIYLPAGADAGALLARLRAVEGVDVAISQAEACARFELPPDRIGDIVVISTVHKVLGTSRDKHDLSGLTEPLRSHGGLTEQVVPMIANRAVTVPSGHQLRNFDVFDVALNRVS